MKTTPKKQEEAVRKILQNSKVNADVAIGALRFPAHCRECGRELLEQERMKFEGLCFDCAKKEVLNFREQAVKKYITPIIIWVIIEIAMTLASTIDNRVWQFVVDLFIALIIDCFAIYAACKYLKKRGKTIKLRKVYSVYIIGVVGLVLVAYIVLLIGSLAGVFLFAGICYLIYRDIEGYRKRKAAVEKFALEERRREKAEEDAKRSFTDAKEAETDVSPTYTENEPNDADLCGNDWNI